MKINTPINEILIYCRNFFIFDLLLKVKSISLFLFHSFIYSFCFYISHTWALSQFSFERLFLSKIPFYLFLLCLSLFAMYSLLFFTCVYFSFTIVLYDLSNCTSISLSLFLFLWNIFILFISLPSYILATWPLPVDSDTSPNLYSLRKRAEKVSTAI